MLAQCTFGQTRLLIRWEITNSPLSFDSVALLKGQTKTPRTTTATSRLVDFYIKLAFEKWKWLNQLWFSFSKSLWCKMIFTLENLGGNPCHSLHSIAALGLAIKWNKLDCCLLFHHDFQGTTDNISTAITRELWSQFGQKRNYKVTKWQNVSGQC